jgi:hypothetical protein
LTYYVQSAIRIQTIFSRCGKQISNKGSKVETPDEYIWSNYQFYTGKKLKEIGLQFGIGESGVSQSCRRVAQKIEKDKKLKKKIDRLEK